MNAIARPRTFLNLVVDASVSMHASRAQTINALNELLDTHRGQRIDEMFVTLTTFDTKVKVHYTNRPIADVEPITERVYRPDGMTALYDGIAKALTDIDKAAGPGGRVLVVVLTDGEDTASRELDLGDLVAMVRGYDARGNWTFTFLGRMGLGAAMHQGRTMGFKAGNIHSYSVATEGLVKTDDSLKQYRQSDDLATDSFFAQPKKWKRTEWTQTGIVLTDEDPPVS